jgi:hypothetical protein
MIASERTVSLCVYNCRVPIKQCVLLKSPIFQIAAKRTKTLATAQRVKVASLIGSYSSIFFIDIIVYA